MAEVVSINISDRKSVRKRPVESARLVPDKGVENDAHAEGGIRQVSLLAVESIEKMRAAGLDLKPGDFAENITTRGIDLLSLPVGTVIRIGEALLEVSQHGKICHTKCAIYKAAGDCVMPKEGIFCRVLHGGIVSPGIPIERMESESGSL